MPSKYVHTEVDGRKLKLSNLEKIIYPSVGLTKAEVIRYSLKNADRLLEHIGGRALTVIRFPDGVGGKSFYSKDKPEWTPDWMDSLEIQHEQKVIDYLLPKSTAGVVWLANLACLELHPMQFIEAISENPDYFVFDLDPDESLPFELIKEAAFNLKEFLNKYDYSAYIKTSGGKGLHVFVPIRPEHSFELMIESVKKMTRKFVAQHESLYTLQLSKQKRKGKILIDIYRNHRTNTTVAPFSLRGKPGAPISMPFFWEHLEDVDNARQFTMLNYAEYLDKHGYAWEGWQDQAAALYDQGSQVTVSMDTVDQRLTEYLEKRDMDATPEPAPNISLHYQHAYVIQLHDARNLHYDLRLENQGVLMSWAIPKGLPFEENQKRLAIRTEDHPIKYLHFEGVIPKGEYGAGRMKIVDTGIITWIEKEENKYSFTLSGERDLYIYKLFKTKHSNQWLITTTKTKEFIDFNNKISPMLADSSLTIPVKSKYSYEVKWDGIRVLIYIENDKIEIVSRNGRSLTNQFPELFDLKCFEIEQGVFDGEIVVLDTVGRPIFSDIISRMHTKGAESIRSLVKRKPVTCYLFDVLTLDGRNVLDLPLIKRRDLLEMTIKPGVYYRFSESFSDGKALFLAIEAKGMEGIMAKRIDSKYLVDSRSSNWLKIKCRKEDTCLIIGYTAGKGDRKSLFGALHLAKKKNGKLAYYGKVGTGFDHEKLRELNEIVTSIQETEKPIDEKIEEESRTTWIEPELSCEIEYASLTSNRTYREPVFKKLVRNETSKLDSLNL